MLARSLMPGEEAAAAAALRDAFQRDSFAQWIHPESADRRNAMGAMFSDLLASPPPGAEIDVTEDLEGVAVWLPPGSDVSTPAPPGARPEVAEMFSLLDRATPPQPFWYLMFLGARTGGAGIGTALLQHRAQHLPTALWTGSHTNVGFYERHGFRIISHHAVGQCSTWWLRRD